MYACDLKPIVSDILELLQWFLSCASKFYSIYNKHKIPYIMTKKDSLVFL